MRIEGHKCRQTGNSNVCILLGGNPTKCCTLMERGLMICPNADPKETRINLRDGTPDGFLLKNNRLFLCENIK